MSDDPVNGGNSDPFANPYKPVGGAGESYFDGEIKLAAGQTRGMTGQSVIVGVLMIVQGVFNLLASVGAGFYAWFMPRVFEEIAREGTQEMPAEMPIFMMVLFAGLGVLLFLIGALLVYSGIGVIQYKRRALAMVALSLGMLTIFTCYCFPTSFALGIYGLIFLMNQPVAMAFQLRKQGYTVERIQQAFQTLPK